MTQALPAVTTLAPWYGSDRMVAAHYARELDGCSWVGIPFAGGMSIAAHLSARTLLIGDLHQHVVNLANVAADPVLGPKLYRSLRRRSFSEFELERAQRHCRIFERSNADDAELFGSTPDALVEVRHPEAKLQWAEAFFISAWMARNGRAGCGDEFTAGISYRWDANGGDSCTRFRSATKALVEWRRVLSRATIRRMDAFDFLEQTKDVKGCGLYVDAPWPEAGEGYRHSFDERQQRRLATTLSRFDKTRVVIRFGDHPLIRELYPREHWTWVDVTGRAQTNGEIKEAAIINGANLSSASA